MSQSILTINAGSSSIKFALFPLLNGALADKAVISGQIDGIGTPSALLVAKDQGGEKIANETLPVANPNHQQAFDHLLSWFTAKAANWEMTAVGHRVVHGGQVFSRPVRLETDTLEELSKFIRLAPLHQPHNLAGINAIRTLMPKVPQVGCFDTAFHSARPREAQIYGLPRQITDEGVQGYGFHGLSYEYIARVLPEHSKRAEGRVIIAHLGNGASMAAMVNRKGVATTMGFTPTEGLVMGTRSGELDPAILPFIMEKEHLSATELDEYLNRKSGILGISGMSSDFRDLEAAAKEGDERSQLAIDVFAYRVKKYIGGYVAAMGGVDAIVFTAGLGENSPSMRDKICNGLEYLGTR
ncbi:MAG: acetate/propionate family kinase, partial [Zoogloeaceae bacterium]|nr:acetate/propionate family kinase [Zoogloeaceae bacterium]